MIFAFGALAMGLFGAFFLPAYKKRAVRLAQRQLEAQMPMSMQEVNAGRDALRAQAAVQLRTAEMQMTALHDEATRVRAELGRGQLQISNLLGDAALARSKLAAIEQEHAALILSHAEMNAQNSAMQMELHSSDAQTIRHRRKNDELLTRIRDLDSETQVQRASIAALETRVSGREMQVQDLQRELEQTKVKSADQERLILRLQTVPHALEAALADLQNSDARLKIRFDKAKTRIGQLENMLNVELEEKSRAISEAEAANAKVIAGQKALSRAQASETTAHSALLQQSRKGQNVQSLAEQEAQALRLENATLQGALQSLRLAHGRRNQNSEAAKAKAAPDLNASLPPADFEALRKSIIDLGREITRHELSNHENNQAETDKTIEALRSLKARAASPAANR